MRDRRERHSAGPRARLSGALPARSAGRQCDVQKRPADLGVAAQFGHVPVHRRTGLRHRAGGRSGGRPDLLRIRPLFRRRRQLRRPAAERARGLRGRELRLCDAAIAGRTERGGDRGACRHRRLPFLQPVLDRNLSKRGDRAGQPQLCRYEQSVGVRPDSRRWLDQRRCDDRRFLYNHPAQGEHAAMGRRCRPLRRFRHLPARWRDRFRSRGAVSARCLCAHLWRDEQPRCLSMRGFDPQSGRDLQPGDGADRLPRVEPRCRCEGRGLGGVHGAAASGDRLDPGAAFSAVRRLRRHDRIDVRSAGPREDRGDRLAGAARRDGHHLPGAAAADGIVGPGHPDLYRRRVPRGGRAWKSRSQAGKRNDLQRGSAARSRRFARERGLLALRFRGTDRERAG